MTLRGATQAEISVFVIPAASIARTVAATGSSSVGASSRFQRRSESKIGSRACLKVGCCAQASTIMFRLRNSMVAC